VSRNTALIDFDCNPVANSYEMPGSYGEFGLEMTNPIPTTSIEQSSFYLARLTTSGNLSISYIRTGSRHVPNIDAIVDKYRIFAHGEEITMLYICPYGEKTSEKAPAGFKLVVLPPELDISSWGEAPDVMENTAYSKFFSAQMRKLPDIVSECGYIFYKAASFLATGAEKYRYEDSLGYPLKSWDVEKLTAGCNQIVYHTKGFVPEHCLDNMTESEFKKLLKMFHFGVADTEKTSCENIVKGIFVHKMTRKKIEMYCRILKDESVC
jgi:hypothetical protein